MPKPRTLKLTKPWGKHPLGAVLTVLAPGDAIGKTSIDEKRAATLLSGGFAVEPDAPKTVAAPAPAPAQSKPKEVTRG